MGKEPGKDGIQWECINGHQWYAPLSQMDQTGTIRIGPSSCPECGEAFGTAGVEYKLSSEQVTLPSGEQVIRILRGSQRKTIKEVLRNLSRAANSEQEARKVIAELEIKKAQYACDSPIER